MPADPDPAVARALAPLVTRLGRMDPAERFREAARMGEGCRQGMSTFAGVRVEALREMQQTGFNTEQMVAVTGLSRQRIEQLLKGE